MGNARRPHGRDDPKRYAAACFTCAAVLRENGRRDEAARCKAHARRVESGQEPVPSALPEPVPHRPAN